VLFRSTEQVLVGLDGADVSSLARKNLGFKNYDWRGYLDLSRVRVAHALAALASRGVHGGRILDYGAYFGNFSLAAARLGHQVSAFDSYRDYGGAFAAHIRTMQANGITIIDADDVGFSLSGLEGDAFDAVFLMGVIEHIPSSPKALLEAVVRVLKPGGVLIIDTPNIAYAYNRRRLAMGHSVHAGMASQYYSEMPFSGHHREFTIGEVQWMLGEAIGLDDVQISAFNYSMYGLSEWSGLDLALHLLMEKSPALREVIFAHGVKRV